jgi:hypothetical protein
VLVLALAARSAHLGVIVPVLAAQSANLELFGALMAVGFLIGIFGHLSHSRALIVVGILIIAVVSVYFSFVLEPPNG